MKRKFLIIGLAVTFVGITAFFYQRAKVEQENIQKGIAKEIIRFHVIANSDTVIDQGVKLEVKNTVVKKLQKDLVGVKTIDEARTIISKEMGEIEHTAQTVLKKKGFDYTAKVKLTDDYFPIKEYGDLVFPQGDYEALEIRIGKAKGKNWWCVLFPSLCFIDSTYQVVPEQSKELLKENLSQDEYESLLTGEGHVEYKFKIAEWWNDIWN